MCSCEPSFTCSKCAGTPFDPRYEEDAYEPMQLEEFDRLAETHRGEPWQGWV